jgi:hypothetical protein
VQQKKRIRLKGECRKIRLKGECRNRIRLKGECRDRKRAQGGVQQKKNEAYVRSVRVNSSVGARFSTLCMVIVSCGIVKCSRGSATKKE